MGAGYSQDYLHRGTQALLGLFLTSACPLCDRATSQVICPACERQVRQSQLADPLDPSHPGLPVISWGRYEDALRHMVRYLKYSKQPALATWLGLQMGQTWQQHPPPRPASRSLVLLPIPLHASKLKQRGFNQAERLAQGMSRTLHLPVVGDGLVRVQATQAQHSLGRENRQTNLAHAFQVNPLHCQGLRQHSVWLVDDIFTTGATATTTAQVLRRNGISVAGICTAARAESLNENYR